MTVEKFDTLIIGGGQAGLAMSAQLKSRNLDHIILERKRIVERWRSERWDSLVANGPAWHDRFPTLEFTDEDPNSFVTRDRIVRYFETFAKQIDAPTRCGVDVLSVEQDNGSFRVETSAGKFEARNVVVATGPFQLPLIPTLVPQNLGITQMHSSAYKNPEQLPPGAVLVVGAGSSGGQIADELLRCGKQVYLSVGPHGRPPIRYRGKDFCWWLGVLGQWDAKTREPGMEHVTISVSGARGGTTVNFRNYAERGMMLLGRVGAFSNGKLQVANDLARNIEDGEKSYLAILDKADAYVEDQGLNFPEEPEARKIDPAPNCMIEPILSLDLKQANINTIIWATGYALDFSWLRLDAFDAQGRPDHVRGVSKVQGLYFLGLPWLSCRASPFIWGVWRDAEYLANHIANQHELVHRNL